MEHTRIPNTKKIQVHISNDGWYLFNCIPLACGNARVETSPTTPFVLFRNDVTMDKLQYRFMNLAAHLGRDTEDIRYYTTDTVMFEIPGLSFPLPLPYILCQKRIQLTGVLK